MCATPSPARPQTPGRPAVSCPSPRSTATPLSSLPVTTRRTPRRTAACPAQRSAAIRSAQRSAAVRPAPRSRAARPIPRSAADSTRHRVAASAAPRSAAAADALPGGPPRPAGAGRGPDSGRADPGGTAGRTGRGPDAPRRADRTHDSCCSPGPGWSTPAWPCVRSLIPPPPFDPNCPNTRSNERLNGVYHPPPTKPGKVCVSFEHVFGDHRGEGYRLGRTRCGRRFPTSQDTSSEQVGKSAGRRG
jgi:hypothetical protein